jgi:hypothetical protein
VQRLAPAIPRIAALFGVEIAPKAQMPRPLRNEWRDKKAKTAKKPAVKPVVKPAVVPTEAVPVQSVPTEAGPTEAAPVENTAISDN